MATKRDKAHENTDPDFKKVQKKAIDKAQKAANQEQTLSDRLAYQEEVQAAYVEVSNTPAGQIILKDLDVICRYNQSCYSPDSVRHTDFNLGRQSVIIGIHNNIKGIK